MKKGIILCIIVGVILGTYLFSRYDKQELDFVLNDLSKTVYVFQYGVYESKDSLKNINVKYTYELKDDKYYVYIGMTTKKSNIQKLENYFNNLNIKTYIKEIELDDEFYNVISQYDLLLDEAETNDSIKIIMETVVTKFEEIVLNDKNKRITA